MSRPELTPLRNLLYHEKILKKKRYKKFSTGMNVVALMIIISFIGFMIFRYQDIKNKKEKNKYTKKEDV